MRLRRAGPVGGQHQGPRDQLRAAAARGRRGRGAVEQRRLQTAFSVTYTIVYDPDVVAISVDTIAETVTAAAEKRSTRGPSWRRSTRRWPKSRRSWLAEPINPGGYWIGVHPGGSGRATTDVFVAAVVITETTVTVLPTEAPTFWSDTGEHGAGDRLRRQGGVLAVSDLPACGCDDDTTGVVVAAFRSPAVIGFVVFFFLLWRRCRRRRDAGPRRPRDRLRSRICVVDRFLRFYIVTVLGPTKASRVSKAQTSYVAGQAQEAQSNKLRQS